MSFKTHLASLFVSAAMLAGTCAVAEEQAPPHRPCMTIAAACRAAGYQPHAQDKNLRRDCMKPILGGGTVEGVTVDANDVLACQSRIAEHRR